MRRVTAPVARGNARGAAVVGRQTGRHGTVGVSEAHGVACVRFQCGPPRDAEGVVLQFVDHAYCHRS